MNANNSGFGPPPLATALQAQGPDPEHGIPYQDRAAQGGVPSSALNPQWAAWFNVIYARVSSLAVSTLGGAWFAITPAAGVAIIDLANGTRQQLVRNGSAVAFVNPVSSVVTLAAGMNFILYVDQDAVGGRSAPTFPTGPGGFAADVPLQSPIDTALTRTIYAFTFSGSVWALDSFRTNASIA